MTPNPIELVFKRVDGLEIAMDVHVPNAATRNNPVPVLLWWHGKQQPNLANINKLITFSKAEVYCRQALNLLHHGNPIHMVCRDLGYKESDFTTHVGGPEDHELCLVSADYRLAPQTRMPEILADCKAAMDFLYTPEFSAATDSRVDSSRVVLSGSSAGGWLSILSGTGIGYEASGIELPRPVRGIAAIYPITDLQDAFWKTKQRPVSYMDRVIAKDEVEPFIDPSDKKACFSAVDAKRSMFYTYMVQEGLLSSLLLDGTSIPEDEFSVAQALRSNRFSPPPTYIVHGNIDDKVPIQQALDVVSALKEIGKAVEYDELNGLNHRFDVDPAFRMENMYKFIVHALKA